MKTNLFIDKISLNRDKISSFEEYPFNIEIIKNFEELKFTESVTFFVGENGTGKSTFIEAIAVAMGLNAEGCTWGFNFVTKNTSSNLSNYLKISRHNYPENKFFLRAESFYNVATKEEEYADWEHPSEKYHEKSHGERFLALAQNYLKPNGVYFFHEPEASLSPQRQLTL